MATSENNTNPQSEKEALRQKISFNHKMDAYYKTFNPSLLNGAHSAQQSFGVSTIPMPTDQDKNLAGVYNIVNANLFQVYNTISTLSTGKDGFHLKASEIVSKKVSQVVGKVPVPDGNTPYEELPVKVPAFDINGSDIVTLIGGKAVQSQANFSQFGNKQSAPQYSVASFDAVDAERGLDVTVDIKFTTHSDGGVNSYPIFYMTDNTNPDPETNRFSQPGTAVSFNFSERHLNDYINSMQASDAVRNSFGLLGDDILRLESGLPHPSQMLDQFFYNLPAEHHLYGEEPFAERENDFIRTLHSTMINTRMRHDYAALIENNNGEPVQDGDYQRMVRAAENKVHNDITLMLTSRDENPDAPLMQEEVAINIHRTTFRNDFEIKRFLDTDPTVSQVTNSLSTYLSEQDPKDVLQRQKASGVDPDVVNLDSKHEDYKNIRGIRASAFNPNSENYRDFKPYSPTRNVMHNINKIDFGLGGNNAAADSLIVVQGQDNYNLIPKILDTSVGIMENNGIKSVATPHFDGLKQDTFKSCMQDFYAAVKNDRNNAKDVPASDFYANAKQTIVLANTKLVDAIEGQKNNKMADFFKASNVAFIKPQHPYTEWSDFVSADQDGTLVAPHIADSLFDFEHDRHAVLSNGITGELINADIARTELNSRIAALVTDAEIKGYAQKTAQERFDETRKVRMATMEEQIADFEESNGLVVEALSNKTVRETVKSMSRFAKQDLSDLSEAYDDYNALSAIQNHSVNNNSTNAAVNSLVIGLLGKTISDDLMSQRQSEYKSDPDFRAYANEKNEILEHLEDYMSKDVRFEHSQLAAIAEKTRQLGENMNREHPDFNQDHHDRVMDIMKKSVAQFNLDPHGTMFKPDVNSSTAVRDIGPNTYEKDIAVTLEQLEQSKANGGILSKHADASELFSMEVLSDNAPKYESSKVEDAVTMVAYNPTMLTLLDTLANNEKFNYPSSWLRESKGQMPLSEADRAKLTPSEIESIQSSDPDPLRNNIENLTLFVPERMHDARVKQALANGESYDAYHFSSKDIQSIGSAHKNSAAAELGLTYMVTHKDISLPENQFKQGENAKDYIKRIGGEFLHAKNYPNTDIMMLDLVARKFYDYNDGFDVQANIVSVASGPGTNPIVRDLFQKHLVGHFKQFDSSIHTMDTEMLLKVMNVDPEISQQVVHAVNNAHAGVDEVSLDAAVKSEDFEYLQDTVRQAPEFQEFMQRLVTEQIESDNNKYSKVDLDIKDTVSGTFPALPKIKEVGFEGEPSDPASAVSQLMLEGSIIQKRGKIDKHPIDLTQVASFEDALIQYMAERVDYLDSLPNVELASGAITTKLDDPKAKAAVDVLNQRGMGVAHPDMFKMGVAEFADKHFPNETNHEFNSFREPTSPRKNVINSVDLEIIVQGQLNGNTFEQSYKLSDYPNPERLLEQQKSDFRIGLSDEHENLKVTRLRGHNYGRSVVDALIVHGNDQIAAYPNTLPKDLWTKDVGAYFSDEKLVKPDTINAQQIEALAEKADQSYKAVLDDKLGLSKPDAESAEPQKPSVQSSNPNNGPDNAIKDEIKNDDIDIDYSI